MPSPTGPVSRLLRYRRLIAVLAGAATSLAFAPYDLFFLAILGPAVLFLLWEYEQPREAAGTAFWFGAALFGAGTWWIFTAVHDFGQAPVWLAVALVAALLAIKGAYYALLAYVVTRIAPDPSPARSLLLIPAGWTLMDWLRGWLVTGFPWLQLGYSQSDTPLASLATVGGPSASLPEKGFDLEQHVQDLEREYIAEALRRSNGVKMKAAELLGMSFRSFRYYMKKYNLK
jgi:apolipoprotein N-acyltransferase